MNVFNRILRRLRLVARNERVDDELSDELRHHIELEAEELLREGWEPEAARREAFRRFGGEERTKERVREGRRGRWLADLVRDLRHGMRSLRKSPGFTFTAIAILTLGIGATTAIFSLFHAVLVQPLPYPQPEELLQIWNLSGEDEQRGVSGANLAEWSAAESFTAISAYRTSGRTGTLTGTGDPEIVNLADVQPAMSEVIGMPALLGRFLVEEDTLGDGLVTVLSHAFWERRFGADSTVVGRALTLDGRSYQIVGVLPRGFGLPDAEVDLWLPLTTDNPGMAPTNRARWLLAVGRLRTEATLGTAQAEMTTIASRAAQEDPELAGWNASLVPLQEDVTAEARTLLTLLLAAVAIFLLVACGNLANLLLARAVGREREIAVRGAIGAGRGRILRQLLTESMMLACFGGAAGALVTPYILRGFITVAPPDVPLIERAGIDVRMLFVVGLLSAACAVVFGLAPALHQTRTSAQRSLRSARGASRRHTRVRAGVMVMQVSLAVVLLIGAGLFIRTVAALTAVDVGYEKEELVTMRVALPTARYPTADEQSAFLAQLSERVGEIPQVLSVSGSDYDPGFADGESYEFVVEGRGSAPTPTGREGPVPLRRVAPDYFEVLRQRVVRGRGITANDLADSPPVVVVNESFARGMWPSEDPIGQRISRGDDEWEEVVGVVSDAQLTSLDEEPVPRIYAPHVQRGVAWRTWWTVIAKVRAGAEVGEVQEAMRATLLDLDPDLPPQRLATVEDNYAVATASRTFAMVLAIGFGMSALLLSLLGLYGLINFSVVTRRREICLRVALGADNTNVVRGVVRRALALTGAGGLLGVLIALGSTRAVESMLFGVQAVDAVTYGSALVLVLLVAVGAAAVPAWRATKVEPVTALSTE